MKTYPLLSALLMSSALMAQDSTAINHAAINATALIERQGQDAMETAQAGLDQKPESATEALKSSAINYQQPSEQAEAVKFTLKAINYEPASQLIPAQRLSQITARYTNRPISFNDLQRLRVDLINVYHELGYTLSIAAIPPQRLENQTLRIQLVESKVKEIRYEGNTYLRDSYFDRHVGSLRERYFNIRQLEEKLTRFNHISKMSMVAKSTASEAFGYSNLRFQVYEPDRYRATATIDNNGTERLGKWRYMANFSMFSPGGRVDDNVLIGTSQSEGSNSWYALYEAPVNTLGTRASISGTIGRTKVANGTGSDLDIKGESHTFNAEVTHPLYISGNATLEASLSFRHSSSESFFVGEYLDDSSRHSVTLGLEGTLLDSGGKWYGYAKLTSGRADRFDAPDQSYFIFSAFGQRTVKLDKHSNLNVWIGGQWADQYDIPSGESYFIGGPSSVRGYEDGAAIGASGASMQAEWTTMPFRYLELEQDYTLNQLGFSLFADLGTLKTYQGIDRGVQAEYFSALGAKLTYFPIPNLLLSLSYAEPLKFDDVIYNERNWSFSAQYSHSF